MAIEFVDDAQGLRTSPTLPTGVVFRDTLLVHAWGFNPGTTFTVPGYSQLYHYDNGIQIVTDLWWKEAGASEGDPAVSVSGTTQWSAGCVALRGVDHAASFELGPMVQDNLELDIPDLNGSGITHLIFNEVNQCAGRHVWLRGRAGDSAVLAVTAQDDEMTFSVSPASLAIEDFNTTDGENHGRNMWLRQVSPAGGWKVGSI